MIREEADKAAFDEALTETWHQPDSRQLGFASFQLGRFGRTASMEYQRRAQLRAEMARQALASHDAGHFAAAMTLILSQIDGLTSDVMGSSFFQHVPDSSAPGYVDDATFAGAAGSLPEVRKAFSTPQDKTGRHTSISRHAIMHGRDLTFGTRINSTKAFVLFSALIEFLEQRALIRARRERRQNDGQLRKLRGYDENGRLMDSRCIEEVAMFRADLETDMWASLRNNAADTKTVELTAQTRLAERRLHRDRFSLMAAEGHRFAWSFHLPAGHFLASSVDMKDSTIPVQVSQLTWDQAQPPAVPPWIEITGWDETMNGTPQSPNWQMRPFFT